MSTTLRGTLAGTEVATDNNPPVTATLTGMEVAWEILPPLLLATAAGLEVAFDQSQLLNPRRRRVASLILDDRPLA